jgi:hypothetical protein
MLSFAPRFSCLLSHLPWIKATPVSLWIQMLVLGVWRALPKAAKPQSFKSKQATIRVWFSVFIFYLFVFQAT